MSYYILVEGQVSSAERVFHLQKRSITHICDLKYTKSCRELFRREGILTIISVYILTALKNVNSARGTLPRNGISHDYDIESLLQKFSNKDEKNILL